MRRLWAHLLWLAAALALAGAPLADASPAHRVVAVGDLHGDFAAWRDIARAAKLIDDKGRWMGGGAILVQTGDVVDRGPESLKIVQDLMRLQGEARRAHGQVIALVGNHEAMNVIGDLRYVTAADYAAFADGRSAERRDAVYEASKAAIEAAYRQHDPQMTSEAIKQAWFAAMPLGRIEHQIAWNPGGRIGRWIVGNPAVALVDGTLFVHGGISPAYARLPIDEINRQIKAALMAQSTDINSIINDPMGPLWYRGLAIANVDESGGIANENSERNSGEAGPAAPAAAPVLPPIADQVANLLAVYGARRIVIGHTPVLSGIAMEYDGQLIRIDTGITAVYGGKLSYLDIVDGTPVPHVVERSTPERQGGP